MLQLNDLLLLFFVKEEGDVVLHNVYVMVFVAHAQLLMHLYVLRAHGVPSI